MISCSNLILTCFYYSLLFDLSILFCSLFPILIPHPYTLSPLYPPCPLLFTCPISFTPCFPLPLLYFFHCFFPSPASPFLLLPVSLCCFSTSFTACFPPPLLHFFHCLFLSAPSLFLSLPISLLHFSIPTTNL
jgi:hypothetical protein